MQEDKTTPLLPSTLQLHLSQKDTSKGVHRFDLQGLRGVAILSVLGFHFFSKWFPNGYVGVDQFFVLSGYLMAMILDAGSGFSHICDFYYRRLKRIIPMYILIILFILWSCLFIFPQSYLDLNGKSVIPALIFLSNLWRTAGGVVQYFAELNVAENLVVHTWSLAVEMQFYLVVPILHVFLREYSTRSQITCLLIVGSASFAFHVFSEPISSFYHPFARIWQFLAGHLAYLSASTHRKYALVKTEENTDEREHEEQQYFTDGTRSEKQQNFAEMMNVFVLLAASFFPRRLDELYLRLTTVVITMALITRQNSFFRSRCLTHFGDISYTLYLVHWPIYCWIRFSGYKNSTAYCIGGLGCAWFISVLLTRTFERWYRAANKATVLTMIAVLYALTACTAVVINYRTTITKEEKQLWKYQNITLDTAIALNTEFIDNEFRSLWYDRCDYVNESINRRIDDPTWWCSFKDMNESASHSALIIGNSWAANHARVIHEGCRNHLRSMTLFSTGACEVLVQTHTYHSCNTMHRRYDEIIRKMRPDYLFVIARHVVLLPRLNLTTDSYSLCLDRQVFSRIKRIQKPVKKKVFILDALPRTKEGYLNTLNLKLLKHEPVNQTEFIEPTELEFARSILRRAVSSCKKCSLISYDRIFGTGKSFQVFDPLSKVAYFTNGIHISAAGLWKIAPVYERLCGSF